MEGRQTVSLQAEAGFSAARRVGSPLTAGEPALLHFPEVDALLLRREAGASGADFMTAVEHALAPLACAPRTAPKYLVLDMGDEAEDGAPMSSDRVATVAASLARLVLDTSVVPVAYLRGHVAGAELTLALACSMIVCEADATFRFDDLVASPATYALLAQKIGFVRAERLIERNGPVTASEMRDLLLIKASTPAGSGLAGLREMLGSMLRRYNSSLAIFRAQRIATPLPEPIFGAPQRLWTGPQAA